MEKAIINREQLVIQAAIAPIRQPYLRLMPWLTDKEGKSVILPRMGSITYNVEIGDSVYGMQADHVEPGVTLKNPSPEENNAIQLLACIGNSCKLLTGEAKGERGFVTGKHGGVDHLLVYFPRNVLEKMSMEDKIQIRMQGRGMQIAGFEDKICCLSMGPELFDRLAISVENGKLHVPVAARIPAYLMGSGIGEFSAVAGDYDIMTQDWTEIKKLGLDRLRYGDIVLLEDCDNTYGRGFCRGAVTIGVVVHSDCVLVGHGPGVTALLSSKEPVIEGVIDSHANLADLFLPFTCSE